MIRVLEVVGRMDRAGQETFLMNLFRTRDTQKYEITFSVNTNYIGAYEEEIKSLGGKIWHNPYPISIRTIVPYLREFRKFLRSNGPFDVIHCHVYNFGGFLLKIAKEEDVPIRIMHSHSTNDGYGNSFYRNLYRNITYRLIKKYATDFVACGTDAYESLFRKKCESADFILNNGIIMHKFLLNNADTLATRKKLNIPYSAKVLISVARFCDVKNHEKIVSVFSAFHKNYPNSKLLLVGDGPRLPLIKELVCNLKLSESVLFLGQRDDIPLLLNASDVLLMPSKFEGLPVTLVEAQAAGISCVISDTITQEVDMGLGLVEYVNLSLSDDDWASVLSKCLNQKSRPDYKVRSECLAKRGYTIESTWIKLNSLYESL